MVGRSGPQDATIASWLTCFEAALRISDLSAAVALFTPDACWRDLLGFTWNIQTFEGHDAISAMLGATLTMTQPRGWRIDDATGAESTEAFVKFDTATGRGKGHIRLRNGKCFTLLTALQELKGFEEPTGARRSRGAPDRIVRGQRSWRDRRRAETAALGNDVQPHIVIVGGGQGGLGLAARLKMLGVPTLIIDRQARTGDQWRSRYNSLCLHDPVWYDHLPYLPFPDHWPVFTPKDKIADWLELYASAMELDIWNKTECVAAAYDQADRRWTVNLVRDGQAVSLQPAELVFALGGSGKPLVPAFAGADLFEGPQLHSSEYRGDEHFSGRRITVIGSNNSAHDICADLWERGFEPTMIQRSPTLVVRSERAVEIMMKPLYSDEAVAAGMTTERADLLMASLPLRLLPELQKPLIEEVRRLDADFYDRLEAAGFLLTFGEDGSGLYPQYLRTASGYYIDVGASELVADGRIALRSGVGVTAISHDAVVLTDGSSVPSDAIVYATGFGTMDEWVRALLHGDAAKSVTRTWGYGSGMAGDPGPWEGELRGMWTPLAQEALWFHGGNLHLARHYSKYLALQLKARFERLPMTIYPARSARQS